MVKSEWVESQNIYMKEYIYDYCRINDRTTDQINHNCVLIGKENLVYLD